MSNKSERVYHFLTEKNHRRLCLHKFSYLQYWQNRHNAEPERKNDVKIVLTEMKNHAGSFVLLFAVLTVLSAIIGLFLRHFLFSY